MKIGILTQPLHSNYGGLLQAWALQKTLSDMGHDVTIINRVWGKSNVPLRRRIAGKIKNYILIFFRKRKKYFVVTDTLKEYAEKNILPFKKKRYKLSPELKSDEELRNYLENNKFDAYVVGSDQVWRPIYSPRLMTYFLDFAKDNHKVKKIAYAASFGVDNWEFSEEETKEAAKLAPLFDLITVRESSGIDLVKRYLNCEAIQALDPTLLRSKEDYLKLIDNSSCPLHDSDGDLFCYVLDKTENLNSIIKKSSEQTRYKPYYCNYLSPYYSIPTSEPKENCVVPPVEQWIKSFADAKMIITDSFHGTVFSIIFNKPFWVVTNATRGTARFLSLLKQFGLEDRIVNNPESVNWNSPIEWPSINSQLLDLKEASKSILIENLN